MTRKKISREFSPKVKGMIRERAEGTCEVMIPGVCRGMQSLQCHHRKNRSQGGMGDVVNGLLVCLWCHEWIGKHPQVSYDNGWLVKMNYDPAEVPVTHRGHPVLLDTGGSFRG